MSGSVANIKTIPCWVTYDGEQVGYTDTPVEFLAEVVKKEITADQNGEEAILELVQGNNVTVSFTMKEFNRTVVDKMMIDAGLATEYTGGSCSDGTSLTEAACLAATETWTPADNSVLGIGSAKRGANLATLAKKMVLTPIDTDEASNSVVIWKASPTPGGINFSGTDETQVEMTFRAFEDTTKPSEISKAYIGDPSDLDEFNS